MRVIDRGAVGDPARIGFQQGAEKIHGHTLDQERQRRDREKTISRWLIRSIERRIDGVPGTDGQKHRPEQQQQSQTVFARQDFRVAVLQRQQQDPTDNCRQSRPPADDHHQGKNSGQRKQTRLKPRGAVQHVDGKSSG